MYVEKEVKVQSMHGMEAPQPLLSSRPPCHCPGLDRQPKILHSLLQCHQNGYYDSTWSSHRDGGASSTCSSPGCSSPRDGITAQAEQSSVQNNPIGATGMSGAGVDADSKLFSLLMGGHNGGDSSCATSRPPHWSVGAGGSGVASPPPHSQSLHHAMVPPRSTPPLMVHRVAALAPFRNDSAITGKRSLTPGVDEPMDLSVKRPRFNSNPPYLYHQQRSYRGSDLSLSSCQQQSSRDRFVVPLAQSHSPSPAASPLTGGSILKSILDRRPCTDRIVVAPPSPASISSDEDGSHSRPPSGGGCSSGNGTTRVSIAKKNMCPVIARVNDWLLKMVRFARSVPEFSGLPLADRVTLLLNSWAQLLLLYMAENNFHFVITSHEMTLSDVGGVGSSETKLEDQPTFTFTDSIQTFIRKCQTLSLEAAEYDLLRMLVLFNPGHPGLDRVGLVEKFNGSLRTALQEKCGSGLRYSQILLRLPSLTSFSARKIENLFCARKSALDTELLLKDLLHKPSLSTSN